MQAQQAGNPVPQQQAQYYPQPTANVGYAPVPVGDPNYQQNPAMNAPMPGWPPAQPMQPAPNQQVGGSGGPFSQQPQQQYYAAGPNPYSAATYTPQPNANRGVKAPVYRVLHDHSQIGDDAYFERSCGTLLSVSGTNLTVTPSGGESPLIIPAREIVDIRINNAIGKEFGVFHIATRQGLYLSLAPDSSNPEEARRMVSELRSLLGLTEK
jgi:hypothetical protein